MYSDILKDYKRMVRSYMYLANSSNQLAALEKIVERVEEAELYQDDGNLDMLRVTLAIVGGMLLVYQYMSREDL